MSESDREEARRDYLMAYEELDGLLPCCNDDLQVLLEWLHECGWFGQWANVPTLVSQVERELRTFPPDVVDRCNQYLHVMLANAQAVVRGAW